MKILDKQKVMDQFDHPGVQILFCFASGGEVKTSWTHSEWEENSAGD